MNLIFRMLYVLLASAFRPRLPAGQATSEMTLMTFPNDLDINLHVNNGRYLTLCDLNRVDLFIRSGLASVMIKKAGCRVVVEHTMNYRKSLGVFARFKLITEVSHWDEKFFFMTHRFTINENIIAEGTSKGAVRDKDGVIAPEEVIAAVLADRGLA